MVEGSHVYYRLKFAAHLIPGTGPAMEGRLGRRDIVEREQVITSWLAQSLRVQGGGGDCSPEIAELIGPDLNDDLAIVLDYSCPQQVDALRVEFHPFDRQLEEFQNIVSIRHRNETSGYVFTRNSPLLVTGRSGPDSETRGGRSNEFNRFLVLGIEHIWSGYDHLLFLLAVLLVGGGIARLAGIVTAFTVAHSITLALAALKVFSLPPEPVELAIAASIVYVAAENLSGRGADHRWLVTFGFGLIHGFGFAGVLVRAGLSAQAAVTPLVGFNLGVEAGQLVVVAVVVPGLRLLAATRAEARVRRALSWLIVAAGGIWAVERAVNLLA